MFEQLLRTYAQYAFLLPHSGLSRVRNFPVESWLVVHIPERNAVQVDMPETMQLPLVAEQAVVQQLHIVAKTDSLRQLIEQVYFDVVYNILRLIGFECGQEGQ